MRRGFIISIAVAALALLPACPHQESLPWCRDATACPPLDPHYSEDDVADGIGKPGGDACRSLRARGCAEGYVDGRTRRTCFQRLERESQLVRIPYECVAMAKSADDVRACGTKDTLRFRCRMPSISDPTP